MRNINWINRSPGNGRWRCCLLLLLPVLQILFPALSFADNSTCAEVKIEILQELTLERQGFDAHMTINNGLSHITLENVMVEVRFEDEEGNPILASSNPVNTGAVFFIRKDSGEITDNQDGSWDIAPVGPASSSDLHWLIIPSTGASNGKPEGTLYFVGARLTYTIGGEAHVTEVTPDYIHVKPMPELQLDYFLTREVFGDDAWTAEIEPPVPFTLGVRVKNNGFGAARSLKIDSAQPKIVENEQGLLIGFVIESCEVNGGAASRTLLADLGNISPNASSLARWKMSCTLSGQFTEFNARFSHSDELGGELTSLITGANTHFLIRDVVVDVQGRDAVSDFLTVDGAVYKVFESDGSEAVVQDLSANAVLQLQEQDGSQTVYAFTIPQTTGCVYARVPDPSAGLKALKPARRSDGKAIKPQNIWLSKTRNPDHTWNHFINIFDTDTTGVYSVVLDQPAAVPHAPVLQFIPDRQGAEGQPLSFLVEASDPDGTVPALSIGMLPAGADFTDHGNGTATFTWVPALGQAGDYPLSFNASDGSLSDAQTAAVTICSGTDIDCDGMPDAWETEKFGDLSGDGTGDNDGDGIPDYLEYLFGTDPLVMDHGPSMPEIKTPMPQEKISSAVPALTVFNSTDPDGDSLTYIFELFSDPRYTEQIEENEAVEQGSAETSWTPTMNLSENTWYYWRVRASDGVGRSLWNYGSFFVNTANEPPGPMHIAMPEESVHADATEPLLSIDNSTDPDEDPLAVTFTVYADPEMTVSVSASENIPQGESGQTTWKVSPALADNTVYYWSAAVRDPDGAENRITSSFYVQTGNSAPAAPVILWPEIQAEVETSDVALQAQPSTDPENDSLAYIFEIDTVPTFDSPDRIISEPVMESAGPAIVPLIDLKDNTVYYWRVKSSDGAAESAWSEGVFRINTQNDPPEAPVLKNPGNSAWTGGLTPELSIMPGADPDADEMTYTFEIYEDALLSEPVYSESSETDRLLLSQPLENGRVYYWRVQAVDEHGEISPWSSVGSFFAIDDGIDEPPSIVFTAPSGQVFSNDDTFIIQWQDADSDSNARIALYHDTDDQGGDGTLIATDIAEDPDGDADAFEWDISGLEGTFHIYAVITDEASSTAVYASAPVFIDRTPAEIIADPPAGAYNETKSATLSTNENADIYYTVDGTIPTPQSALYTGPVDISQTTVLSAISVDAAGNISPPLILEYVIEQYVNVQAVNDAGEGIAGIRAYAFTENNAYINKYAITDEQGISRFNPADFAPGNYKFRIDYLGHPFWTDILTFPTQYAISRVIEMESVRIDVASSGANTTGVRVYLFTEAGSYLNVFSETDENGEVVFQLPAGGSFKFRADVLGYQFFSQASLIDGQSANLIPIDVGGGRMTVKVQENPQTPIADIRVYLFSENGSYLNLNQAAAIDGTVAFDVPQGVYKARADYLGMQFWTDPVNVVQDIPVDLSIPHTDVAIAVHGAYQETAIPMENIPVYLFTPSGSYLNQYQTTDGQGNVQFHLPDQSFKVRADVLGFQYWSGPFTALDAVVSIPLADARVIVTRDGQPVPDVATYLFSGSGSYLNRTIHTGTDGSAVYRVPAQSYQFRADYLGDQHWSESSVLTAHQVNPVEVNTGGGRFELTVTRQDMAPLAGITCHLYNAAGTYLNVSAVTSSDGKVSFDLANGDYKIRADYMGYQFWTAVYPVPSVLSGSFVIQHNPMEVGVSGVYQTTRDPMTGINVYLFTEDGAYLNRKAVTDALGKVVFDLPEMPYKIRADVLGGQYWSNELVLVSTNLDIPMAEARVTVTGAGLPLAGLPVYLYSESGAYLNLYQATDALGQVRFRLPAGTYQFRADYQASRHWSGQSILSADAVNDVAINAGGGLFSLTVLKNETEPLANTGCYLFNGSGSYLNLNAVTSSEGLVTFNLSNGTYKIRIDHLGYQFWTPVFTVPDSLSEAFILPCQDVSIAVQGLSETIPVPLEGLKVYLYTPSGSYLNQYRTTNASGIVVFNVPNQPYKVRADYLGYQFWSDPFQFQDHAMTINQGRINVRVHQSGTDTSGAKVYLFTPTGSYLNWVQTTDASGTISFTLPDRSYKFRADYGGIQRYSTPIEVISGTTTEVQIDLAQ